MKWGKDLGKIRTYAEVKRKYLEFVNHYLAEFEGTERSELMPSLWSVVNQKKGIITTIQCQMRTVDPDTMEEEWYAVVNKEDGKREMYLLEFGNEAASDIPMLTSSTMEIFQSSLVTMSDSTLLNFWGEFYKIQKPSPEDKFKTTLAKMEILNRMRSNNEK